MPTVNALSELFCLDLPTSVETASRARHDFDVVVLALAPLDVPDDILDVPEPVSAGEPKQHLGWVVWVLEHDLLQILVLALDVDEWLLWVNCDPKQLLSTAPENVLQVPIRCCVQKSYLPESFSALGSVDKELHYSQEIRCIFIESLIEKQILIFVLEERDLREILISWFLTLLDLQLIDKVH